MLKTNRNGGGIDRAYEVATSTTIKRGEMVAISSGKLVNCSSGVPFGVAMADGTGGEFISVALNLPGVEWEVEVKSSDQATTVPGSALLVNDKNSLKLAGDGDTAIFKVTEVSSGKFYGYFVAH